MDHKFLKSISIPSSEITPEPLFINRRRFMQLTGLFAAGTVLAACAPQPAGGQNQPAVNLDQPLKASDDELGAKLTPLESITNYNNYYEFSMDKEGVAAETSRFKALPWTVQVDGLVNKPKTYSLEELLKKFTQEERVYRMRCVEGWSMVIPWLGFPLAQLLKEVEPTGSARYVAFETVLRPEEMPGQREPFYPWPYQEGLRLDEALNNLTILSTGLYGKGLLAQNGAPLRLVVPWKYGFKSLKSIVKITLTEQPPKTFWSMINPREYGFFSNVNPNRPHPRWSQATERRIGEGGRRETLMFNGYAEQVASLYQGMDLMTNY